MEGYVATIGMFDGVHQGHQFVLRQVVEKAHELGLQSLCITFDHSLRREQVLTPLDQKLSLIRQTGIDRVEVLSFTDALRQMTARDFMQQVLYDRLGVRVLLTGYDNRFGHNREEGFDDYVRYGRQMGIDVLQLPAEGTVSSSHIRQLLDEGQVAEAARCLGYHYTIQGSVVHGQHIGTSLGFPTANLTLTHPNQQLPAPGAYAVSVSPITHHPSSVIHHPLPYKGMMNIGTRPTFDGHHTTLEVHVLHLHQDLYGQQLQVSFVARLRPEQRFPDAESLRQQLQQDALQAEQLLAENLLGTTQEGEANEGNRAC